MVSIQRKLLVPAAFGVLHVIAALGVLGLALLICADVLARTVFSSPIHGVPEIVESVIVAIVFMQLPYAIHSDSMLRTTILCDVLPEAGTAVARLIMVLLGIVFFSAIAFASWEPLLTSIEIREYSGDGTIKVPVYPVKFIIVALSVISVLAYLTILVSDVTEFIKRYARKRPAQEHSVAPVSMARR